MSLTLALLLLTLAHVCVAPAVSDVASNPASFIHAASPLQLVTSPEGSPNTCKDLDNCRSLVSIVTSCLATIFACVWVAVHPNIPGPKQSWISKQIESVKVVVVTLLVPEWVLAWAVRQFLQAREYATKLEAARLKAADEATVQHHRNSMQERTTARYSSSDQEGDQTLGIRLEEQSTPHDDLGQDSTGTVNEVTTGEQDNERESLIAHRPRERSTPVSPEPARKLVDLWQLESDSGRIDQPWTITHTFFMIGGGFHSYHGGKPVFPLHYDNVLALVKSRSLVPPTSDELGDKSKGDSLSKTIAIIQTLWFVAQCIARHIENLVITNLEIMTLAYTVITVAMYAAWWHKPLKVRCPVRVTGDRKLVKKIRDFEWTNIIDYVTGDQDCHTHLSGEDRVPTFWSSCTFDSKLPLYADIISLSVAMVFGAVHCDAWSYLLPSLTEQWMWRVCAIAITAIPLPMALAFAVFDPFLAVVDPEGLSDYIPMISMALGALLYIPARMTLLLLSFTTLRQLPLSAYETVRWTTWIPHI